MPEIKLTVCFFTKNNQKYIEKTIKTLEGIASEIVFFDLGSTDKTKSIVEKYGKFYSIKYSDDNSKLKNEALKKIDSDWVLFLEPDEELTKETQLNLINFLKGRKVKNYPLAYYLKIIEPTSKQVNTYYKLCLIRNKQGMKFINPMFEDLELEESNDKKDNKKIKDRKIFFCTVDFLTIFKTGIYNKTKDEIQKENENNIFKLNKIIKEHKNIDKLFYYYHIGNTLFNIEKYSEALKYFKMVHEGLKKQDSKRKFLYENNLVSLIHVLFFKTNDYETAISYINEFLEKYKNFPEILFYKALYLIKKQNYSGAKEVLLTIQKQMIDSEALIVGIKSFQDNFFFNVMLELTRCSILLEEAKNSAFFLKKALDVNSNSKEILLLAIIYYIKQKDYTNSLFYYKDLIKNLDDKDVNYIKNILPLDNYDVRKLNVALNMIDAILSLKSYLGEPEKKLLLSEKKDLQQFLARITFCVFSYGNQTKLEACYRSILPLASEIITVELSDSNLTHPLALEVGRLCTVEAYNYKTKNFLLDAAKGEYVFFIQANQLLSEDIHNDLLKFLYQYKDEKNLGISMNVWYKDEKGEITFNHVISLLKLTKEVRFDENEKLFSKKGKLKAIKTKFPILYNQS